MTKGFYTKYRMIIEKEIILPISQDEFLEVFRNHVDAPNAEIFFFTKPFTTYNGVITNYSFKIKENLQVFNSSYNDAILYGHIYDANSSTMLQIESDGITNKSWVLFIGGLLCFFMIALAFKSNENIIEITATLFLLVGLMILICQQARSSARKMLHKFERELSDMVEKK